MTLLTSAGAAIAALGLFASPAFADEPTAVAVKLAHVSPTTQRQVPVALGTLRKAALEACGGSTFSLPEVRQAIENSGCFRTSMDDVVARIDNPLLTAAYQRQLPTVEVAGVARHTGGTD